MKASKKITSNIITGILGEVVAILLGIIVPRLTLTSYGSEVNGLVNSVTQIYSYIGLLEAGIGTATLQALYKTVGKNDKDATNSVLAATNKYYHRTGILYLIATLLFSVIYPLIISSEIPLFTMILIIVVNGIGNVIQYFFQAKFFLLLQAEGKNYIKASLGMFTNVLKNVLKIVLMSCGFDVLFAQAIAIVVSLVQMIYISLYIRKKYKWIDLSVTPNYKAISQSKNVLVHQISMLIFNSTDNIVLSVFCGLRVVSVYSMYTLFFSMIQSFLSTFSNGVIFTLGQAFSTDRKRFMKLYDCFELYYMTLVFAVYSIAYYFILPFLRLYTSSVNDINYIDKYLPILFISTYLLSCGRTASSNVINFAEHFKLTQNRAIIESIINISVSLIAVQFLGIFGVLIGTIAALLYRTNDMIIYASKNILFRSASVTYKRWLCNLAIFIMIRFVDKLIVLDLSSYIKIILWAIPYGIGTFILFFGLASILEPSSAKLIGKMMISRLKRIKAKS